MAEDKNYFNVTWSDKVSCWADLSHRWALVITVLTGWMDAIGLLRSELVLERT